MSEKGMEVMDKFLDLLKSHPWLVIIMWLGGSGLGGLGTFFATKEQLSSTEHRISVIESNLDVHAQEINKTKEDLRSLELQLSRIEGSVDVINERLSGVSKGIDRIERKVDTH